MTDSIHERFRAVVMETVGQEMIDDIKEILKTGISTKGVESAFTVDELIQETGATREEIAKVITLVAMETCLMNRGRNVQGRTEYSLKERLPKEEINRTGLERWVVLRV